MLVIFRDPDNLRKFAEDSLNRIVRLIEFQCPCGKQIHLYITKEPFFYLGKDATESPKAWHYEIINSKVNIMPSIDLTSLGKNPHPAQCHFTITGADYQEDFWE